MVTRASMICKGNQLGQLPYSPEEAVGWPSELENIANTADLVHIWMVGAQYT